MDGADSLSDPDTPPRAIAKRKPTVTALSNLINRTRWRARSNTLLLVVLYVVVAVAVVSLHRNIFADSKDQGARINDLNAKLGRIDSLLHTTIASVKKFNRTVTNADLADKVAELSDQVATQTKEVKHQLHQTKDEIDDTLKSTLSDIDATVTTAQKSIAAEVTEVKTRVDDYKASTQSQFDLENNFMLYQLAGTFTLIGSLISLWHVTSHLRNFHNPVVQRKILAILWMAPIYSTTSWFALVFTSTAGYLSILKDCYEAYVVYVFLSFLISVLGNGDRDKVVDKLATRADHLTTPCTCCGCCFKGAKESPRGLASAVLYQCQICALQFVLLKPLLAVATFVVNDLHYFPPDPAAGKFDYKAPGLYILVLQNISVSLAFFGLLKFYHAVQDDLMWCQPWPKFLCIKGVVFMTFWQGLAINILAKSAVPGSSDSSSDHTQEAHEWGKQAQSFLICIEMLVASIAHFYVFPHDEWKEGYVRKTSQDRRFGDNLALRDFVSDLRIIMGGGGGDTSKPSESPGTPLGTEDDEHEDRLDPNPFENNDAEMAKAAARIRTSLASLEAGTGLTPARVGSPVGSISASSVLTIEEGRPLLDDTAIVEDRPPLPDLTRKPPATKSYSKRTKFRPSGSRIHR